MHENQNNNGLLFLLTAMSLALLLHGITFYFTMPQTYDAYVHLFFADHYSRFWFEPWEYRWYTGFLTVSYPPLAHQCMALLMKTFPAQIAITIYTILILEVLVIGVYRFIKLFFDKKVAGIGSLLIVIYSSIIETVHVFGQLPTITGIAFLLNALPFIYLLFTRKKVLYFFLALAFISVVISAHHVTAIFGMVLFIAPTIYMALHDKTIRLQPDMQLKVYLLSFIKTTFKNSWLLILFGGSIIALLIGLIYPYWNWSFSDPIQQVPIPHGSRENYFSHPAYGLMFYIFPLFLVLIFLPILVRFITFKRRYLGWAVAFILCMIFGLGGTTPIARMLLGENAFQILTLDRFSFWASIIILPFLSYLLYLLFIGDIKQFICTKYGHLLHQFFIIIVGLNYLVFIIYIFHLGNFRSLQPKKIDLQPLLNFINRDDHIRWRYLTLGFGDQMAWLSANTLAATVDGNYHSARRLPELTSRPVERLENSKFLGNQGLETLQDFLCNAEKYNLKYVFSNDRYYDPLLYYNGWTRTIRLENGIVVWEKGNITSIQPIAPKKLSKAMKLAWGIVPIGSLMLCILLVIFYMLAYRKNIYGDYEELEELKVGSTFITTSIILPLLSFSIFSVYMMQELLFVKKQDSPANTVHNYFNELDFQNFDKAFLYFKKTPVFTLEQYMLEKSVNEGGLLPTYAKLDSIYTTIHSEPDDRATVYAYTRWKTSLGYKNQVDTLHLEKEESKWFILPPHFEPEIPEDQVLSNTMVIFKKIGKRVISSFPTVKDDRITKSFAAFTQLNLWSDSTHKYLTGEILNADDTPINLALRAKIIFQDGSYKNYFPATKMIYNLSPKGKSFFQLDLDSNIFYNKKPIDKINVYLETDVSERGYIHGSELHINHISESKDSLTIHTEFQNRITFDINIPGLLIAHKNTFHEIIAVELGLNDIALRSGYNRSCEFPLAKKNTYISKEDCVPLSIEINGTPRFIKNIDEQDLDPYPQISILQHSFIGNEFYLQ